MSRLALAISGTHGTGKTWIVDRLGEKATSAGILVNKLQSPTRRFKKLGFDNNQNLDYKLELLCITERIKQQRELARVNYSGRLLILSDRCGIDELSYTQEATTRMSEDQGSDLEGYSRLVEVYKLLYDWVFEETLQFFDKVYYKPPHPDFPPVVDEARISDVEYQLSGDRFMKGHHQDLRLRERQDRFPSLDIDREVALEQMWKDVQEGLM